MALTTAEKDAIIADAKLNADTYMFRNAVLEAMRQARANGYTGAQLDRILDALKRSTNI